MNEQFCASGWTDGWIVDWCVLFGSVCLAIEALSALDARILAGVFESLPCPSSGSVGWRRDAVENGAEGQGPAAAAEAEPQGAATAAAATAAGMALVRRLLLDAQVHSP